MNQSSAEETAAPPAAHPFSWLPYAQMVRLPNVFTAMADVLLAALVTGAFPDHAAAFALLLLASCCLYCGGMVWNDYFDIEQDRRERPFRPLPSGRVSPRAAAALGACLLLAGVGCAGLAGALSDPYRPTPLILAVLLAGAILAYDGGLKRTPGGPVAMGACRFLNVLLGLSMVAGGVGGGRALLAVVVGVYITGVTWFARTEARPSNRHQLLGAAAVMLAGLLLALVIPVVGGPVPRPEEWTLAEFLRVGLGQFLFPYLLVGFAFHVGVRVHAAIQRPVPERVQPAVKRAVLGLVALDAILAAALVGTVGLAIAFLLAPAHYLGRWLYST